MAQVGTVSVVATIDTSQYKRGAKEVETANSNIAGTSSEASKSTNKLSESLSKVGKLAKIAAVGGVAALAAITVKAAKSSWEQVNSVQQATATLGRFYDSAEDVTKIQQELIKYAQSDMGVLFNRKDLFAAAGNLAMYNVEADKTAEYVKIMSRLAASGAVSWDDLNAVIGRVISSGKLSRIEWEQLNKAGAGLDDSLANTTVTAESLFKILDNNVAKDIRQDMNNIVPVGIRLQSAFRSIGNAVLGVNKLQDGFMPNSLGQRIIDTMKSLTDFANRAAPSVREAMEDVLKVTDGLIKALGTTARVIWNLRAPIAAIVVAYGAYRATVIATNTVLGIQRLLFAATGTQILFMNGSLVALRTTTVAATIAQKALNLAMKLNPIGLVIAALGGLVTILGLSKLATEKQDTATDRLNAALKAGKVATDNLRTAEDNLKNARLEVEGSTLAVERAQRTYNETVRQYGPKSLEAREAAYSLKTAEERLRDANKQVEKATNDKTTAEKNNAKARKDIASAEAEKRSAYRRTTSAISGQNSELSRLGLAIDSINGKKATYQIMGFSSAYDLKKAATGSGIPYAMPRFNGGPVSAGRAYLVGENRDGSLNDTSELFIPNRSGRIVSSKDLQGAMSSEKGGITNNIQNVNIASEVDGERWIRRLSGNQEIVSNGLVPTQSYM